MYGLSEKDICTEGVRKVVAGPWPAWKQMITNVVAKKLELLKEKFPVEVDFYCMMENHIHFIIPIQARQERATTLR